ncbi:oxaloacetate decarboxylase subunit alpha [Helicovermis profundi]|uniref:Oxaloacetate decarboxylase subunit alpha n=1 Tax=Helicovermis profundi TaxID=3065157 RepID=A0AAU9E691_9FIRM|nr:oxaloacetate decarboxylase subunit alpha [Clostridia bacterium S502]
MSKIKITETILRDAHQSLIATRLNSEQILPILNKLDSVGYHALEMWGGATFDASLRFLNENPWQRLRMIKDNVKNTKLQMLLRGQNILGYKHYPDDVVREFVKRSVANGIDIVRIFDALNDTRNLKTAIEATIKEGAHAQAAISYTTSPIHTLDTFVNLARDMENMGADSICIKDMSGLLTPYAAFDLVKALKSTVKVPIELHSHSTSGLASMTYLKGIEAGVDIIDTAISPFSLGTSQPPTESLVATLNGTKYDTKLDLKKLNEVAEYFTPIREDSIKSGLLNTKVLGVNINSLIYQVPGGMLSNLVSQLEMQNAGDRLDEVLKEVPRVREDLGYPPLVTPTSQIVGTQAVLNVITGERYKMIPNEVKAYVKGMYGKSTVPIKKEIIEKIIGNAEIITSRPADLLEPMLENKRVEIKEFIENEEDVLSYILFPQVAMSYFNYRESEKYKIDTTLVDEDQKIYPV